MTQQTNKDKLVNELLSQRKNFMAAIKQGCPELLISVQFIDNLLKDLIPSYIPDFKS